MKGLDLRARAIISFTIQDNDVGEALIAAVEPDNQLAPAESHIYGEYINGKIIFKLDYTLISRLTSTVDDLLACLEVAYETIYSLK